MSQPRIYASYLVSGEIPPLAHLQRHLKLKRYDSWGQHVCAGHATARAFFLNRHAAGATETYLGSSEDRCGSLGDVWSDYIHVEDQRLGISSMHVSMRFSSLSIHLDDPADSTVGEIAGLLDRAYGSLENSQSSPLSGLRTLAELCSRYGARRRHAPSWSRYVGVSITGLDDDQVSEPSKALQVNIYRLLYLHSLGVSFAIAEPFLSSNHWSSASFYRLYFQPGGTVTLSSPFPEAVQRSHPLWFHPEPPAIASRPTGHHDYDLLPEYPPLRYLAYSAIAYAAACEEILRDAFERLMDNPFMLSADPSDQRIASIVRRYYLARNLEAVRLPVARSLVRLLVDSKQQSVTGEAVHDLSQRITSWRSLHLSVVALAVSVLSLVVSMTCK